MAESQPQPTSLLESSDNPLLRRIASQNDALFALGIAVILAVLLFPLPTFLLDILLACSIGLAVATLVTVLAAHDSIELNTFPALLLGVTLFRLALNVASTRLILIQADAGQIIQTFGSFVIGGGGGIGALVIGLVVFLIIVVIQFVVITKGAERISEVGARFNLDAMPGKQMAIDADLNAGIIGEEEAKARREKIVSENEFYGAMDGASKFIRGDAIAGLIITSVNLVGGIIVGLTRELTIVETLRTYSILAVGDGLVSQIPAVIVSTSSGFLITKTSSRSSISADLIRQMLNRSRPLALAAFVLAAMIFVPGFPKLPFIGLALVAGVLSRVLSRQEAKQREREAAEAEPEQETPKEQQPEEMLDVDRVAVQVGPRLIKIIDPRREDSLTNRIVPLRRRFAEQFGVLIPLVRFRDNVSLDSNAYEIRIYNHVVARGNLEPDKYLAMDPGTVKERIQGEEAEEPVFNMPALWIDAEQKEEAEVAGYTVVDPESVLVTHLSETIKSHLDELLSRDDVQKLVDRLKEKQPTLVNGIVGESVSIGTLHRVLQNLLSDQIPVTDLMHIIETLGDHAGQTRDTSLLTEVVRKSLVRTITEKHTDRQNQINALVLDPQLEYELKSALESNQNQAESLNISADQTMTFARAVAQRWKEAMERGHESVVLLCDVRLRMHLASILRRQVSQLPVIAYDEILPGTRIQSIGNVSLAQGEQAAGSEGQPAQAAG